MNSNLKSNLRENLGPELPSDCPKYSAFRLNTLKDVDYEVIKNLFFEQSQKLNTKQTPKYYLLRKDCLVVEKWPHQTTLDRSGKEVIVDAICAAAVLRGSHVFACGVLGLNTCTKLGDKVEVYGDLDGKCKRGYKLNYNGRKLFVGTGYLKMTRRDIFIYKPSGIAVHMLLPASNIPVINESDFMEGQVTLQNLPSIVCGWVVDAKPKEYILDMCAAPGNKTTHLAEMSSDQAIITAIDRTSQKVDKIKSNCKSHNVNCVEAYVYDSTKISCEKKSTATCEPPFLSNTFDKVLLDAPCSGLGQRPLLVNTLTPKMLQSYVFLQRKLFKEAINVLKVDGYLIYSTCTNNIEENENMVAWVLLNFPCMTLVPAEPLLGGTGSSVSLLSDKERLLVQHFGLKSENVRSSEAVFRDTIGFFIAKFQKIKDNF